MDIYQKLIPLQSCLLCLEQTQFCICPTCVQTFTTHSHRCQSCAIPLDKPLNFCGQCLHHPPAFTHTYTLYDYQDAIAHLIKLFKYQHHLCIGTYFAHPLHDLYQTLPLYDAIIPMPLSKQRIKRRGFNQVLELLQQIKTHTKTPIDTHSVHRIKPTRPLFNLTPEQRLIEIQGAFKAHPMPYQKILLVDDIITTGTSLNELATTILKTTTVTHCDVLTLSRTP